MGGGAGKGEGRQKASQHSPGPGQLVQGFEGPRRGRAGSGLRSVLVDPSSTLYQGLTLRALGWKLGPRDESAQGDEEGSG